MVGFDRLTHPARYQVPGLGGKKPWYLQGGISAENCIAAYKPIGAASLAASYINLANPGTYDLTAPTSAPTFNPAVGWTFNGTTQYLATGITPTNHTLYSILLRFSGIAGATGYICGFWGGSHGAEGYMFSPWRTDRRRYFNGTLASTLGAVTSTSGVMGIAGTGAYLDGELDFTLTIANGWNDEIYLGANKNDSGTPPVHTYTACNIQCVAIYDTVLSPVQVEAVSAAMLPFEAAPERSFIVIPDTQDLADSTPSDLAVIGDWIVANKDLLNIEAVLHEGDLINTPTHSAEWEAIEVLFAKLDAVELPYLAAIGNHDYDAPIADRGITAFNSCFPQSRYTDQYWWSGGFYEANHSENAYLILGDYLFLTLEFGPRQAVIDWAATIIAANPTRRVWIITHSYEYVDGSLVTTGDTNNPHDYFPGDTHDGAELWTELVKLYENIEWVQSGHHVSAIANGARHEGTGDNANKVVNVWCNWQTGGANPGEACIRIVKLYNSGDYIRVRSYNPVTNDYLSGDANDFVITYP